MEKVDLRKAHKELYRGSLKIEEVRSAKAAFLAVDGVGAPGGPEFQDAVGRLYACTYTLKFMLKSEGAFDFAVLPLECLWFDDPSTKPMAEWTWRLLMRLPDEVKDADLKRAQKIIAEKKGVDASAVRRISWAEGRALQVLHVGPYDRVGESYEALGRAAGERGLVCAGPGHEVYLSDPRRTAPEKLKTIVRMGVKARAQ